MGADKKSPFGSEYPQVEVDDRQLDEHESYPVEGFKWENELVQDQSAVSARVDGGIILSESSQGQQA